MRPNRFVLAACLASALALEATAQRIAPAEPLGPGSPVAGTVPDFRTIVARHGPAVVHIAVVGEPQQRADPTPWRGPGPNPFGMNPFGRGAPPDSAPLQRGLGSGFIVSPDGTILTNAHVVENASEVTVRLTDRREFRAKVLGTDEITDIAVLKIDAKDLPVVSLGQVADLGVGEWVLAIGSPFGFENSATVGVVSAKQRALPGQTYVPFIQTDVAVNPGNSGGPLFNGRGQVVGVNSAIYSRTGGYQGLSFAIPIDVALRVKDQIVATGEARHGRLGIGIQEVTQALADAFGLERPTGAAITTVEPGGPAAAAGLRAGDIVRAVDGRRIETSADLPAVIGMMPPGERVTLDVWRKGSSQQVVATLGALGEDGARKLGSADGAPGEPDPKLGLTVQPVPAGEGTGGRAGLLVREAAGPAARAGVRPGDVLLRVNDVDVTDVADVKRALDGARGSVALLIQRGAQRIFVPVRIG